MWFIGVEVEQETSAPPPKKNPGSAPGLSAMILHSQFNLAIQFRRLKGNFAVYNKDYRNV